MVDNSYQWDGAKGTYVQSVYIKYNGFGQKRITNIFKNIN